MTDPIDPAGLQAALRKAARRPSTDLDKAPHIARRLLAMPGLADVAAQLATAGIRCLTPMSGDAAAILLDAGTQVVRLSPTAPYHPAGIPELLQADQIGRCGQMTWEILPKAETADITHADVTLMARALEARGLRLAGGSGALGRVAGKLFVLHPLAVVPDTPHVDHPSRSASQPEPQHA